MHLYRMFLLIVLLCSIRINLSTFTEGCRERYQLSMCFTVTFSEPGESVTVRIKVAVKMCSLYSLEHFPLASIQEEERASHFPLFVFSSRIFNVWATSRVMKETWMFQLLWLKCIV